MKKFKRLLIASTVILAGSQASAWLMFEPFIGYNKGQEQGTTLQGIGLGARVGLDFKDLFIAFDTDYNDLQQGSTASSKYTDTGVTVGGSIQHTRLWYGIISSSQFSYPSGTSTVTTKGTGSKIGLSSSLGSKLNVNLELRSINYTTSDPGTGVSAAVTEVSTIGFLSLSWLL